MHLKIGQSYISEPWKLAKNWNSDNFKPPNWNFRASELDKIWNLDRQNAYRVWMQNQAMLACCPRKNHRTFAKFQLYIFKSKRSSALADSFGLKYALKSAVYRFLTGRLSWIIFCDIYSLFELEISESGVGRDRFLSPSQPKTKNRKHKCKQNWSTS